MISITEEYSDILLDMSKKACDMRVELYDILKEDEDWAHIRKQLLNAQEILGNLAVLLSHKPQQTLYHGSSKVITGKLLPNISFDYKPYLYATDDYVYALVRCGRFDSSKIMIKEEYIDSNHPYTLVELVPNAFKEIFDSSGIIYTFSDECFERKDNEYVSTVPVEPTAIRKIDNVWDAMHDKEIARRLILVPYHQSDEYFEMCGIDKEAYLERRKERIKKITVAKTKSCNRLSHN